MYIGRVIGIRLMARFAWKAWATLTIYGTIVASVYYFLDCRGLGFPFLPIGLIGTAVAFYVGFKNNSSYERLWEGRRIWGSLVNFNRTFAVFVKDFITSSATINEKELALVKKQLIKRNIAYNNALRIQLRGKKMWEKEDEPATSIIKETTTFNNDGLFDELEKHLDKTEVATYKKHSNIATHIMAKQSEVLAYLHQNKAIDDFKHIEFGKLITEFYNQQGACERIKSFPFPRQYAYFSRLFVYIFLLVLPLGLVTEFSKISNDSIWLTIPTYLIVGWIFYTMEVVGDTSENPFENGINDVPMTAICRTIEIDMLQIIGETEVPERIMPQHNILM
jgi:ion channel-forming bestrophin family protein